MLLTVLGCGTSTGVPLILCDCKVCTSPDPRNHRLRASIWVQIDNKNILIDTSTDFRQQALRTKIPRVDAVLYTHPHADHVQGIDELRSYNYVQNERIPVYGNSWTQQDFQERFSYIFKPGPTVGGGVPLLDFHLIDTSVTSFEAAGIKITPISLHHGKKETVGYRIGQVAYITDCSFIPPESVERIKEASILILDCVRLEPHNTHFNLDQALKAIEQIQPKTTFLTHLGHDFEYTEWSKKLPHGVFLAYDSLTIKS